MTEDRDKTDDIRQPVLTVLDLIFGPPEQCVQAIVDIMDRKCIRDAEEAKP
jgi:hypothetical protein